VVGEHHRNLETPQKGDEGRRAEAVVAHLDAVTDGPPVEGSRQQFEKGAEVRLVERLGWGELPQHRSQLVAQFQQALVEKPRDRFARLGQHPPVGGETGALQGEDEVVRRFGGPTAITFRLLRAVIGRVDLDRRQPPAGVGQLVLLGQVVRIEDAAPRREGPAADTDPDIACIAHRPADPRVVVERNIVLRPVSPPGRCIQSRDGPRSGPPA
jgi:hypothetical protein